MTASNTKQQRRAHRQLLENSVCAVATSASEWIRRQPPARWRSPPLPRPVSSRRRQNRVLRVWLHDRGPARRALNRRMNRAFAMGSPDME
jgi:hypothetical protein